MEKEIKTVFVGVPPKQRVLATGQVGGMKATVFVGISGGVDSSVSAALLKEATPKNFKKLFGRPAPKGFRGYNVVGVFIRTWTPDFIECTWRTERRDAMRVCAHLGIPFLECDAEEEYKKNVADYMINEYEKGNTPNPDVMCNREVKFGVFWNFAKERGADYIATGHYAICENKNSFREATGVGARLAKRGRDKELRKKLFLLKQSPDSSKDQSYFLWTLKQEDLAHILFPIGHFKKTEVRKLADKYKLPTATKKDSQGVCFLGPLDMKDFLKHYIKGEKGNVLNEKGEIIGNHEGAIFFTLGERHGFTLFKHSKNNRPLYVVSKNIIDNTITVSPRSDLGGKGGKGKIILCNKMNWILDLPQKDKNYKAQIRYHGELLSCSINCISNTEMQFIFKKDVLVDKGQSIVIYDGDICLGGGIVG